MTNQSEPHRDRPHRDRPQRPTSRATQRNQSGRAPRNTSRRTSRTTNAARTSRHNRNSASVQRATAQSPQPPHTNHAHSFDPATQGRNLSGAHAAGANSSRRHPQTPAATSTIDPSAGALRQRWQIWKPLLRKFLPQILLNHAATWIIAVAIALIVGVMVEFRLVPATVASLWMVANGAPLRMQGVELGYVPLLPAVLMVLGHAKRTMTIIGSPITVRGLRVFAAASLIVPLLLTLIAWAMLWNAGGVYNVARPPLGHALLSTLLVNGAAIVLGLRAPVWRALLARRQWATWPVESCRLARNFMGWMLVAGGLGALIHTALNGRAFLQAYDIAGGATAGILGLSVLSLLYVPNLMIGGAAVLLGGEFRVGHGASSLFSAVNVELPPLPALAAVPNDVLPAGTALLSIPAVVAIGTVYRYVRGRNYIESPIWTAIGGGAAALLLGLVVSYLGAGQLGVYGFTGPVLWMFAIAAGVWLLIPALLLMWYFSRTGTAVVEDVADAPVAADAEAEVEQTAVKEAAPKEAVPTEAVPTEAAPKEAAPKEAAAKEVTSKEANTREAAPKEANTREADTEPETEAEQAAAEEEPSAEQPADADTDTTQPDHSALPTTQASTDPQEEEE